MFSLFRQINSILTRKDKKILILIIFVILINAVLDLIGISAILPIVTLIQEGPAAIDGNFILRFFSNLFNTTEVKKLAPIILSFFVIFYFVKAAYGIFVVYVSNRFTLSYSRRLTKRLMEVYLLFPYEFHLDNNSSTLIRKSTYDVTNFTETLNNLMNFLTKISVAIAIVTYLFITDYRVACIVGAILLLFSLFVLLILKPHIKRIAKKSQELNSYNYKFLSQAFNGIKESKITNTEKYFTNVYDKNRGKINYLTLKRKVYNAIPTSGLELMGMIGICLSLTVILLLGDSASSIIGVFAVFVYAVIKLLPAITEVTGVINNINFFKTSVDSLYNDLELSRSTDFIDDDGEVIKPLDFNHEIKLNNVDFYYKSAPERLILNNINATIKKNTSVAFCGASGSGKTTTIDIILGLLECRNGSVSCDGVDIRTNMRGWRSNISYIPQTIYLSDDSIRRNIAFGLRDKDIDDVKIWSALEKAQLKEYVESLPEKLDTVIGERGIRMSGGQRQRIGIARAFYRNTNIIVFDEATSALDFETEKNILEHVSQFSSDHTLIIITHRLNTIEKCDVIYEVADGKITQKK